MAIIRLLTPVAAVVALSACSTSSMQTRVEELEQERQDLTRRNTELGAELTACRARCGSLEQSLRERPVRTSPSSFELPDDLKSQGIHVKKNGAGSTVIDIPSDVFFPSGISTLSDNGRQALSRVAELIRKNYPGAALRVEGHADSDPIRRTKGKYHCNWDLSLQRAHSVVHFLVEDAKFDPRELTCAGYGEFHPQDPSNKARNRRVEIVILQ